MIKVNIMSRETSMLPVVEAFEGGKAGLASPAFPVLPEAVGENRAARPLADAIDRQRPAAPMTARAAEKKTAISRSLRRRMIMMERKK